MIDPTSQLAALIRAQFAAQAGVATGRRIGARTETSASISPQPGATSKTISKQERLRQSVVARVGELSPDDPQRQRKAFRIFLESVLTQELGRIRIDEQRFDRMVDEVLERMEADESLSDAMLQAGGLLLGGGVDASGRPTPT
jgi:hypothetical protein